MKTNDTKKHTFAFGVVIMLFFMWGFVTVLNDILIPHLKGVFQLTHFQSMLVQTAFFGAFFIISLIYFAISAISGDPIAKIGYKNGIIIGLVVGGIGCALFYPAAEFKSYPFFLGALFVLASGVTILQIAANPYVAILGNPDTAASRLNLSQGFNSLGTTLAPIIGANLIFQGTFEGADSVKLPYLGLAAAWWALAAIIWRIQLPSFASYKIEKRAIAIRFPHLNLGMIAIFVYVGAEVAIGSIIIQYLGLENVAGMNAKTAGKYLAFYWGGAMIGRFMGAISLSKMKNFNQQLGLMWIVSIVAFFIIYLIAGLNIVEGKIVTVIELNEMWPFIGFMSLNFVAFVLGKGSSGHTLAVFATIVIVLLVASIRSEGTWAMWTIISIGLFNSIMWSNIFTLAIDGLGKYTSQGSSLLVMMILGGAIVPPLQGKLADIEGIGIQNSFAIVIICYAFLVFYGLKGSQIGKDKLPNLEGDEEPIVRAGH